MLILGRKQGQRIVIGEEITIEVVSIDHGTVRLGVVAPRDVAVDREEVAERKKAEKRAKRA